VRELIEYLAECLVDRPEDVVLREVPWEGTTFLELSVGEGEVGMIIGRQGRTLDAIRTILKAVATKEGKRVVLKVLE
jgi:uncharacterized protein